MVVKEYRNVRAFLVDYEALLLEHESNSQLILYGAYHNYHIEIDDKAVFGVVLDEQDACLMFCNVSPYDVVIYTVNSEKTVQASAVLAEHLAKNYPVINGIIADLEVLQNFMEEYKKHADCTFLEKMGMDIMEVREINEIIPVEGTHRLADPDEAKFVARWMIEFQMEALASEMDYEAALLKAKQQINEQQIHFYEDTEHNIVTMAVASRKLAHGTAITYIYTPEEYRGMGYAAANIYYLSKELLEQGNEFCTLFVDKKNPLSNRAYEKVGYKVVGESYEYKVLPNKV